MDETTKVLIGTLSGFLIAFFSEPVKTYIENQNKLKQLRIALYKELIYNYYLLSGFTSTSDTNIRIAMNATKRFIRTEFYNQTLNNNSTLFYQLNEANAIMYLITDLSDLKLYLFENNRIKWDVPYLKLMLDNFTEEIILDMNKGLLDKRLFGKLMNMDENKPLPERWGGRPTEDHKASVPHYK